MNKNSFLFLFVYFLSFCVGATPVTVRDEKFDIQSCGAVWIQLPKNTAVAPAGNAPAAAAQGGPSEAELNTEDMKVVNYWGCAQSGYTMPVSERTVGQALGYLVNWGLSDDTMLNPNPLNAFLDSEDNVQRLINETGLVLGDTLFVFLPVLTPEPSDASDALRAISSTSFLSSFLMGLDAAIWCEDAKSAFKTIYATEQKLVARAEQENPFIEYDGQFFDMLLLKTRGFAGGLEEGSWRQDLQGFKDQMLACVRNLPKVMTWDCFGKPLLLQESVIQRLCEKDAFLKNLRAVYHKGPQWCLFSSNEEVQLYNHPSGTVEMIACCPTLEPTLGPNLLCLYKESKSKKALTFAASARPSKEITISDQSPAWVFFDLQYDSYWKMQDNQTGWLPKAIQVEKLSESAARKLGAVVVKIEDLIPLITSKKWPKDNFTWAAYVEKAKQQQEWDSSDDMLQAVNNEKCTLGAPRDRWYSRIGRDKHRMVEVPCKRWVRASPQQVPAPEEKAPGSIDAGGPAAAAAAAAAALDTNHDDADNDARLVLEDYSVQVTERSLLKLFGNFAQDPTALRRIFGDGQGPDAKPTEH